MRTILTITFIIISAWLLALSSCKKDGKDAPAFTITEMTPGEAFPGETVAIKGNGFGATAEENHVYFNNIEALVNSASATSLEVVVPQGTTTGKVKVEVNGIFAESQNDFTIKEAEGDAPEITAFNPLSAAPGSEITISGHHFSTTASGNNVLINETVATFSNANSNELKVRIPEGATTGSITITVQGRAAVSPGVFVVENTAAAAPVLTSYAPQEGIAGDPVTIQGANFSTNPAENLVYIDGKRASVNFASATTLRIIVPQEAATGKITIRVNGKEVTSGQDFKIPREPVITSFSPAEGGEGTEITILGAHFGAIPANNTVYLKNTIVPATFASENMLKFVVPAGGESGRIGVTVNGMTARTADEFKVGCFDPKNLDGWYGYVDWPLGSTMRLAVQCISPVPADNIITFTGGATVVATGVNDLSAEYGEPYWFVVDVRVPANAQSGPVTLTSKGVTTTSMYGFNFY